MACTPETILVPVDFSPPSTSALALARELAGPFGAELHLLHVRTVVDNPIVSPEDLDEVERILAMSDARTLELLEKSSDGIGSPTHCHVRRGVSPAEAVIDAVSELDCDLVVMGAGKGIVSKSYIGDSIKAVMKKAKGSSIILHSLPRRDELLPEVDDSKHARYWQEAYNGVVMRMDLLALVLGKME